MKCDYCKEESTDSGGSKRIPVGFLTITICGTCVDKLLAEAVKKEMDDTQAAGLNF